MTTQSTKNKLNNIEQQIKKLRERQKHLITKSQNEIGKYLMDTWKVEDVKEAKALIDALKSQVQASEEAAVSSEIRSEETKRK